MFGFIFLVNFFLFSTGNYTLEDSREVARITKESVENGIKEMQKVQEEDPERYRLQSLQNKIFGKESGEENKKKKEKEL